MQVGREHFHYTEGCTGPGGRSSRGLPGLPPAPTYPLFDVHNTPTYHSPPATCPHISCAPTQPPQPLTAPATAIAWRGPTNRNQPVVCHCLKLASTPCAGSPQQLLIPSRPRVTCHIMIRSLWLAPLLLMIVRQLCTTSARYICWIGR